MGDRDDLARTIGARLGSTGGMDDLSRSLLVADAVIAEGWVSPEAAARTVAMVQRVLDLCDAAQDDYQLVHVNDLRAALREDR